MSCSGTQAVKGYPSLLGALSEIVEICCASAVSQNCNLCILPLNIKIVPSTPHFILLKLIRGPTERRGRQLSIPDLKSQNNER